MHALTPVLVRSSVIAALGAFLFGFDTAVISGTTDALRPQFEIFPNRVRARGQALGSFTHWFWAAIVSGTFPMLADWSGAMALGFFAVMMALQFVLVAIYLPETRGISLEQIQRKLGID